LTQEQWTPEQDEELLDLRVHKYPGNNGGVEDIAVELGRRYSDVRRRLDYLARAEDREQREQHRRDTRERWAVMRHLHASGKFQLKEIANVYGVSVSLVSKCARAALKEIGEG
jgi:DNA-directed RNA polymerase specialized sigma subunit